MAKAERVKVDGHWLMTSNKGTRKTGEGFDGIVDSEMGYINYIVFPKIKVIVFNGSYIEKHYRGQGKYKVLVRRLLKRWPGYEFQCLAVSKLVVFTLTRRFGLKITNHPLFFWGSTGGEPSSTRDMKLYPGADPYRDRTCWRLKRGRRVRKGIN